MEITIEFMRISVIIRVSSDRWKAYWIWRQAPICQRCGTLWGLKLAGSCTSYHWEGKEEDPDNPNAPVLLCPRCTEDHYDYWDDMWQEYYQGRL